MSKNVPPEIDICVCCSRSPLDFLFAWQCHCLAAGELVTRLEGEAPETCNMGPLGKRYCLLTCLFPCAFPCRLSMLYTKIKHTYNHKEVGEGKFKCGVCCKTLFCMPCTLVQSKALIEKIEEARKGEDAKPLVPQQVNME